MTRREGEYVYGMTADKERVQYNFQTTNFKLDAASYLTLSTKSFDMNSKRPTAPRDGSETGSARTSIHTDY